MKNKKVLPLCLALFAAVTLSGCTTAVSNAELYFSNTKQVLDRLFPAGNAQESGNEQEETDVLRLDAPANFSIDADGNYTFESVEGADFYLIYFCDESSTDDNDSYLFSSQQIKEDGSGTYQGNCKDLFDYAYGGYLAKVFAFPSAESDRVRSAAATADYYYEGEQSAPELYYLWNTFDGTLGLQVANMDVYQHEAYPQEIEVIFTNTEDPTDVVTAAFTDLSEDNNQIVVENLTRGSTYSVEATAYNESEYVLNHTSETTLVSDALYVGEYSHVTDGYFYDDGLGRQRWNWPIWKENFDLVNGGDAGRSVYYPIGLPAYVPTMLSFEDYVEVKETTPGSAYSYTFYGIKWNELPDFVGWMELYPDGTFEAYTLGSGGCASSTISGTWIDHGDGTATLSYDHSSIVLG